MSVFGLLTSLPSTAESSLANSRVSDARAEARCAQAEVVATRRQVDRLQMICEAMWTIGKRGVGSDDDELLSLIEQIYLRDGRLDGRSRSTASACAECGTVVSVRTGVCLYCGKVQSQKTVF